MIGIKWQLRASKLRVPGRVFKGGGGGRRGGFQPLKILKTQDIRKQKTNASLVRSFGNKMLFEICRACLVKMRDL